MTAEAASAAAQPDPARNPAGSQSPSRRQHGRPTSRGLRAPTRKDAQPMRDDPVTSLVTTAKNGDQQAWDALVERYAPLTWSICRRYQLSDTDAENVGQIVWLRLLDHLGEVRHPAALSDWLAATTRRECLRVLRVARGPQAAGQTPDAESTPDDQSSTTDQEPLLAERHAALREALADLPPSCRRLIALLIEDPPMPDAEISARLGLPIESIAHNRSRCLEKLRDHTAIAALINAEGRDRTP